MFSARNCMSGFPAPKMVLPRLRLLGKARRAREIGGEV